MANLGLSEAELARHVGWDIGVAEVTRALADRLDAPAVLSHFSRLIVDPNRATDDPTLIPKLSDGVVVPANRHLSEAEREARLDTFYRPYHRAIGQALDRKTAEDPRCAIVSMHSFTPVFRGQARPWQVGILWNRDPRLPAPLIAGLRAMGLSVGDNQPYSGRDGHGYTLHSHAEPRRLPHALIEVRQDLIDTRQGAADWAARLGRVLEPLIASPSGDKP
jgi:predicted N-formylglutamate amidohydrolase